MPSQTLPQIAAQQDALLVRPVDFVPAGPQIPRMTEFLKRWALGLLNPSQLSTGGLELTVSKSGAVKFDVGAFQQTGPGEKQLQDVQALADKLGLERVDRAA